jgi:hypothetical protein
MIVTSVIEPQQPENRRHESRSLDIHATLTKKPIPRNTLEERPLHISEIE